MNAAHVISELEKEYPGAAIQQLPPEAPREIVCEFDPGTNHPDFSLALIVIDKSEPHYHKRTVEIYRVIRGELRLHVSDREYVLYEGQQFTVTPGLVHWAEGNETWVEVYCSPAYSPEDHHLEPSVQ